MLPQNYIYTISPNQQNNLTEQEQSTPTQWHVMLIMFVLHTPLYLDLLVYLSVPIFTFQNKDLHLDLGFLDLIMFQMFTT